MDVSHFFLNGFRFLAGRFRQRFDYCRAAGHALVDLLFRTVHEGIRVTVTARVSAAAAVRAGEALPDLREAFIHRDRHELGRDHQQDRADKSDAAQYQYRN